MRRYRSNTRPGWNVAAPFSVFLGLALMAAAVAREDPVEEGRLVVDRVVICFDGDAFAREIGAWDETRFWPVLLFDSKLVPKFIDAFAPAQVLPAAYGKAPALSLGKGLGAVAKAWGLDPGKADPDEKFFLDALRTRGRAPGGAVLLSDQSPEFLGGLALCAGRFHLPLPFEGEKDPWKRVSFEKMEACRRALSEKLEALGLAFRETGDELDFITVANGLPFGYTPSDPKMHGGGYTVDDALARRDDLHRFGWVGRLAGGPARSVYMAMCALFLQPKKGLFFSRYTREKKSAFGLFDPGEAIEVFERFFPTEAIRHPDATLARWRELQWPKGNRYGFLYVNSSGGATAWSTSKGGATPFDIPDSVPAVVHYTHSGSAGRPFDVDTIAGRWMENGAYIYFGSYAEPYLHAFVPPAVLAKRIEDKMPLGAAMRHPYREKAWAVMKKEKDGKEQTARFNMTAPWKLAYFGDPSYCLTEARPGRIAGGKPGREYYTSLLRFRRARPGKGREDAHLLDSIAIPLAYRRGGKIVDERAWTKIAKARHDETLAGRILCEMVRAWIAKLRRPGPGIYSDKGMLKKLARPPLGLQRIARSGATSFDAARALDDFAKSYMAGLAPLKGTGDLKEAPAARRVLAIACSLEHSPGEGGFFFSWVDEALKEIGITPAELAKEVEALQWIPDKARKAALEHLRKKR